VTKDDAYKNGHDYSGVYEDDDPGPAGPESTPPCPICPVDQPHRVRPNTGRAGGFLCEGCGHLLTPNAGGDNNRRRELWAEETKKRDA